MGVPDSAGSSGPAKKRQRLSLKAIRKKPATDGQCKLFALKKEEEDVAKKEILESVSSDSLTTSSISSDTCTNSASSYTDTTSASSSTLLKVPAVASLENSGNTCFMNSILQVLRYTPGFLDNLDKVYQNILTMEKVRKKLKKPEDLQGTDNDFENQKNCWNVVKNVYKVYRDLTLLEERYEDIATDDVMSMAAKSRKILQAVRVLNPMYEGSYQHDAQEFLRCFLCYMQDAEKEIKSFVQFLPTPPSSKSVNPLMQRFLESGKKEEKDDIFGQNVKDETKKNCDNVNHMDISDSSFVDKAKVNLFSKLKNAEVPQDSVQASSAIVTEPVKAKSVSPREKGDRMFPKIGHTAENVFEEVKDKLSELQTANMASAVLLKSSESDIDEDESKTDLKKRNLLKGDSRKHRYAGNGRKGSKVSVNKTGRNKAKKPDEKGGENDNVDKKLIQPSIADMYGKTYSKTKRLGMSGSIRRQHSAEKLFDEMREEKDKLDNCNQELDTERSSLTSGAKDTYVNSKSANEPVEISQSDTNMKGPEYLHTFPHLSGVDSSLGNSGKTESDSDSDDDVSSIIREKKIAKYLHESPRRSPRKSKSEMLISSSGLISKSMISKSESDMKSAKLNLNDDFNSISTSNIKSEISCKFDMDSLSKSSMGSYRIPMETNEPDSNRNCDLLSETQNINQPSDAKIALEPVIKLENCDHVFKGNETSVSASYAIDCLSPSKRTPIKDYYSSNYLKQRNFIHSMTDGNTEELEKAMEAMFNSPVKTCSKTDFIEQLFQGTMLLRTRCFSCDTSTERQEDFQDISVPVRVEKEDEDSDEEESIKDIKDIQCSLLDVIEASTEVEKLVDDNKYHCDECKSYQNAERSIHYDALPDILTLHLKRFSAGSGSFGYISKINDAVDIPMTLPCLRYKCPQTCLRPDHKYKLYAIITHTGVTLTSGHYLAYVRAKPHQDPTVYQHKDVEMEVSQPIIINQNFQTENQPATRGKSGIASKLPTRFDGCMVTNTKVKAFSSLSDKGKSKDLSESIKTNPMFDKQWFECDDETIRVFEESEFLDLLSGNQGSLIGTPYLLFYHKSTI